MFTDLPLDLESEILSRVPATSLQKLQTTCKRWYALFRDPKFVKKNFGKAETQVILQNGNGYSVTIMDTLIHSVNLHGIQNSFDPSIEVACKLNSWQKDTIQLFEILIHCEGLLLCATNDEERLVFWNPCTGQTKWIHCNIHRCYGYALGYETNNKSFDSYKLLIFDNFRVFSPPNFFIYELNSYSWWSLEDVSPNFFIDTNGVTLKGNAYWFASDKEDRLDKFILKFDFTTERFGRLPLPLSFKSDYVDVVLSVVREEKLALLQRWFDLDSLKMNIWVTKTKIDEGKDLSWINFLVVDFGKFVLPMTHNMTFLVDEKNKMFVCCYRDIDNKWGTKFYFAKELYKFIKRLHKKQRMVGLGHFSLVMFQVWFKFIEVNPAGKGKIKVIN